MNDVIKKLGVPNSNLLIRTFESIAGEKQKDVIAKFEPTRGRCYSRIGIPKQHSIQITGPIKIQPVTITHPSGYIISSILPFFNPKLSVLMYGLVLFCT